MSALAEFRVGELYTNDQIRFALSLENLGGIRPSWTLTQLSQLTLKFGNFSGCGLRVS